MVRRDPSFTPSVIAFTDSCAKGTKQGPFLTVKAHFINKLLNPNTIKKCVVVESNTVNSFSTLKESKGGALLVL